MGRGGWAPPRAFSDSHRHLPVPGAGAGALSAEVMNIWNKLMAPRKLLVGRSMEGPRQEIRDNLDLGPAQ